MRIVAVVAPVPLPHLLNMASVGDALYRAARCQRGTTEIKLKITPLSRCRPIVSTVHNSRTVCNVYRADNRPPPVSLRACAVFEIYSFRNMQKEVLLNSVRLYVAYRNPNKLN